ncbi:transposase [Gluconacetobacter entanii]|uniref:transposase n=1 Tax=Gluconacetobacter entanii TaxID=108528 RepID=UPI0036F4457A
MPSATLWAIRWNSASHRDRMPISPRRNRLFIEAVLWIARTGSPWRDLPTYFGHWNSVYSRYSDWTKAGVFQKLFEAVSDDADMEYAMIDGTVVRVHRHGQSAKGGPEARRSDAV